MKNERDNVIKDLFFVHHNPSTYYKFSHMFYLWIARIKPINIVYLFLRLLGWRLQRKNLNCSCLLLTWERRQLPLGINDVEVFDGSYYASVILTYREMALINAMKTIFPSSFNPFCRWHISKNVITNTKKYFGDQDR